MDYRSPADRYGLHRVDNPEGALPQAARRLDPSGPPFRNEIAIDVDRLNIDSASFRQLIDDVGTDLEAVETRVLELVDERGKMENPETGSGGMLLGTVGAIGPDYEGSVEIAVGDRIATLVSLTLTPLSLSQVSGIDFDSHQLDVDGRAHLWPSAPIVVVPEDLDETVSLAIFDVCGAASQTRRVVEGRRSVLVLGAGKSGMLAAATAREVMGEAGDVYGMDLDGAHLEALVGAGILDGCAVADATAPVEVMEALEAMHGESVDAVVNTCNVPDTEMSAILTCRDGGDVLFFNMATSFAASALGAEGVSKDVRLLIGNGYAEGHAEYALSILREYPSVREQIAELVE